MKSAVEELLGRRVDRWVPSPRPTGYRARIDLNVGRDGRLGRMRPGTRDFEPLTHEPLARDEVNQALASLTDHDFRGVGRVEIRSNGDKVVLSCQTPRQGNRKQARAAVQGLKLPVAVDGKAASGDPQLWLEVEQLRLRVSPASFYQVNLEVNLLLVEAVREAVLAMRPDCVLDLYAGMGNLSLPIAAQGVRVTLMEIEGSGMKDARESARRHGLDIQTQAMDCRRFKAGDAAFDVAVLDPPRAGAAGAIEQVLVTRPKGIVYVSCNAEALARDLRPCRAAGYELQQLVGFEMFPGTEHAEVLSVLTR
jgi:23S rRNA (uracil1939-C5)-methyltransferase